MFKFECQKDVLERFLSIASTFSREGIIRVEDKKLHTVVVDGAAVVLTEVECPLIMNEGTGVVGVLFDKFESMVKKGKDVISVEYDSGIVSVKSGNIKYKMESVVGIKDVKVPDIPVGAKISIGCKELADGISAVEAVADKKDVGAGVWFIVDDGKFVLRDKEQRAVEVEYGSEEWKVVDGGGKCRTLITLGFASEIASVIRRMNECLLGLGIDNPVIVLGKDSSIKVGFIVAPRIEVD